MNSLSILIADDHELVRRGIRTLFEGRPEWKICGEAATGREAIEKARKLGPDVVLLDITMPEKTGLEALAEIMAIDPSARVLMCSALGQESKVIESIQKGAKDFVVKPFQPAQLLEAVGKALAA